MMRIDSELNSAAPVAEISPEKKAKLHDSACEFEAVLMSSLWKEGQDNEEDDDENDFGGMKGPFQQLGMQILTRQAAKAEGLGIGHMIERAVMTKLSRGETDSRLTNVTLPADIQDAYPAGIGRIAGEEK